MSRNLTMADSRKETTLDGVWEGTEPACSGSMSASRFSR